MADEKTIYVREIKIGTSHTIATAPYENLKVSAEIAFGVPVGCTDDELKMYVRDAQVKLKEIIVETYKAQKRPKQPEQQQATASKEQ